MKDFFISYNKADRAWAEWIAWQLEEAGYSTEIQAWDFRPGSNFVLEMHRAVQGVERTVAVLSPDYLQALYTQPEWAAAFAQDPTGGEQKLLPVQVRECALKGLLGQVIYIDLVGREENAARDELFKGVSSDRAKPEIPPSFPAAFPHSLSERPPFPGASASAEPYNPSIGWLRRVWNGLTESRMKKLAFIGAFIAALGGIGWQVYTHFSKPETSEALAKVEANQVSIAAGEDVNIGGNVSTHITDIHGVSEEKFQQLSEELGVTKAALKRFFKTLEHKEVPPEDIDSTLRTIAERYKDLQKKLEEVSGEDTAVAEFKRQVKEALDVGDFDRAEKLLNEASAKDLEAARSMQERAKQRLLSAAASKAKNGDLKYTQLAYAEAAEYYRQAAERVPAGEELILAGYLNLQSWASYEAGRYADAQQPLERALALREKLLGPEHLDVAQSLNNLAALYHAQGQYAKAESLYQRALAIREKALGPAHPNTATSLNDLAVLYGDMGAYSKAEPLLQRALAIREKALGPAHPNTALSLNDLAAFYKATGAYSKAEPLLQRALAIREKALGPAHPDTAQSLNNFALLFWAQDRWSEAQDDFRRSTQIEESNAQGILALGDESRKCAYLETLTGGTYSVVTFSLTACGKIADADSLALQVVLQRKGRLLDVLADTYASVRRSLSAQGQQRFDQWRETNAEYAALIFRGPGTMPTEKYRALLDELKSTIEELETQLSQHSAEFHTQTETVTVERVQRAIPEDAALIEWFRYRPFNPKPNGQEPRWGDARYVAYVLKREGQPVAVDLGEATPIERTLSDLLVALHDPGSSLVGELAHELDLQLMQPLRPHLWEARQILLSPDSMLNLLPFGVLADEQGRYLAERLQITYLTSSRDLLRTSSTTPSQQAPIVIADPDFDLLDRAAAAPASENRRSTDRAARAMKFKPSPGTAAEAQALKAILKLKDKQVLTKGKATETALKQVRGPRILHIATQNFFLEDQPLDLESQADQLPGQDRLQTPKCKNNPLLRSGLALAGANRLRSGRGDGVLTALEVAGLDLAGTELAVLSACETGVGAVQNGEGVYGLRRALVLAGVRTQLASLWKVDDAATRDLMIDYYRRLQVGAGRSQALREAQLTMLKDPARAHPYYWASFIAIGEE